MTSGNIVITTTVENYRTGERKTTARAVCRDEHDVMAKVDGLTRDIKRAMDLSSRQVARDDDEDAIGITTRARLRRSRLFAGDFPVPPNR